MFADLRGHVAAAGENLPSLERSRAVDRQIPDNSRHRNPAGLADNGELQIEVSTVRGDFFGRNRIRLRDGKLLAERFYVQGLAVSAETYRAAAAKDKTLPKFRDKAARGTACGFRAAAVKSICGVW
jgi:hypothetical protein